MEPRHRSSHRRFSTYRRAARGERNAQSGDIAPAELARRQYVRQRPTSALIVWFWRLLRQERASLALTLVALSIATVLTLIPPAATKVVFDNVLGDEPLPDWSVEAFPFIEKPGWLLASLALGSLLIAIIGLSIGVWSRWRATRTTKRLQVRVRRIAFQHAAHLPLHRVYELKSGGASSILREDAGAVAELIFGMVYNPAKAIIQLIGVLFILAVVDWTMLLGAIILFPLVYLTHRTWINRIRPLWRDVRHTRQHTDAHATESFGGMRVVRAFGRETTERNRFSVNNHLLARQELLAWWWSRGVDIAWSILIPAATALLLWYGATQIISDRAAVAAGTLAASKAMTVGDLVMFLTYLAMLLAPLATLAASATQFQSSLAGLDRLTDLLEEPTEHATSGKQILIPGQVEGRIGIEGLSFCYPRTDRPVLEDISFEVAPGQVVALVGASGSGKSTLCNLVARFYDPSQGRILLDGTDLKQIDLRSYRSLLGVVEQDIFLFDGTIAENIGYGRRSASRQQIIASAQQAHASEFIDQLPDDYETFIGERGVRLSGGQRQRLAIARAILADPRLLILDEATSNLDTASERIIQSSLETLMRGRTCFVIAHRLSTINQADLILVLDHGRIIQQGNHDQLMAAGGTYRSMIELQSTDGMPVNTPI